MKDEDIMPSLVDGFSIVIPTWNNLPYLRKCVDSICRFSTFEHEILIHVNDGSDGTLDFVKDSGLKHTHSERNLGICRAVNRCAAMASKGVIMYYNDDFVALPEWDIRLSNFCCQYDVPWNAMMSSVIIEGFGSNPCVLADGDCYDFGQSVESFDEKRLLVVLPSLRDIKGNISGNTWPPTLLSRRMWDEVGGFTEVYDSFGGRGSDPDLAKKMWDLGCRTFVGVGDSLVYHFGSKTLSRVKNGQKESKAEFRKRHGMDILEFAQCIHRGEKWEVKE